MTLPFGTTRRQFLSGTAAAAAAPTLGAMIPAAMSSAKRKVLILGGTQYLGPAIVEAALAGGHEVTLFNRGKTNPHMFPELEKLKGQRRRKGVGSRVDQDLSALKGRKWDVVIDTSAYFTANVEDMAAALKDSVEHYVMISSISVYSEKEAKESGVHDEVETPLGTIEDKYATQITNETYGPLKAYCEQAAEAAFPGRTTKIRPGYIVGPGDPFDRLTSRVVRLGKGGDTLAPGDPDAELQMIDVRDLGAFICKAAVENISGAFNATGFDGRISVGEFHHAAKLTLNHRTTFEWVSDAFLEEKKVIPWGHIACWMPKSDNVHSNIDRAVAKGLEFRPLVDTIRDTHEWATKERPEERPWRCGLPEEKEKELLADWREQGGK